MRSFRRNLIMVTVVAALAVLAAVPAAFGASGDLLGTVDLIGNGGQSVGGTFDGTYYLAPGSGGGWASSTLRVYQPPVAGTGR
jgi:hypothetical protein